MAEETPNERMRRLVTGQDEKPLPRRFYKAVEVSKEHGILLDGKPVKTPLKAALQLPGRKLAQAVAAEWQAQEKTIDPSKMPLTKLANTAIDRAATERLNIIKELVDYANSDLICYRASTPPDLVARQRAAWDPLLAWIFEKLGAKFERVSGVTHKPQSGEALATFEGYLLELSPWRLTAHYNNSTLTGSALLATMLIERGITPDAAWAAAHVDEDYQIEEWGEDEEAANRRAYRRKEFDACVVFGLLAG